jgi:hypothetical protein
VTLLIHPVAMDTGIMTIQKMVSQPFTRRMKTGSPCTDAQSDFTTSLMVAPFVRGRFSACG